MEENNTRVFVIGREASKCNQPFPILSEGVSRIHAQVTIIEKELNKKEWVLEDLKSKNGTFILNKKGNWEFVKTPTRISEDTIIRLGEDYGYGVRFMAHHLIVEDENDYAYEFNKVRAHNEQLEKERKNLKNKTWLRIIGVALAFALAFIPESWIGNQYLYMVIGRLSISAPMLIACWVAWQQTRDKELIDKKQESYSVCPNPRCNYFLDRISLKRLECPKCKAKFAYSSKTSSST